MQFVHAIIGRQLVEIIFSASVSISKTAWFNKNDGGTFSETDLATDGILDNMIPASECVMTNTGTNPWFLVDLERVYKVRRITVLNRKDCCGGYNIHCPSYTYS